MPRGHASSYWPRNTDYVATETTWSIAEHCHSRVSLQTNRYSCSNAGPHPAHKSKMKKVACREMINTFLKILNTYSQKVLKINLMCLLKFTKIKIKLILYKNKNYIYIYNFYFIYIIYI